MTDGTSRVPKQSLVVLDLMQLDYIQLQKDPAGRRVVGCGGLKSLLPAAEGHFVQRILLICQRLRDIAAGAPSRAGR